MSTTAQKIWGNLFLCNVARWANWEYSYYGRPLVLFTHDQCPINKFDQQFKLLNCSLEITIKQIIHNK